ncbi:hypothetical protein EV121DRAFT_275951 [Schizophyllum commune]
MLIVRSARRGSDNDQAANDRVAKSKAEMRAESRAATEARLAALKARLTMDAARILKPGVAKVLMPIVLSAIEAAIRAKMWAKENPILATTLAGTALSLILAPILGPVILGALGFGPGGVVLGSWAAAMQASIGNVVAGSLFALAQSAGATGLIPIAWCLAGGAVGGAVACCGAVTYDFVRGREPGKHFRIAGQIATIVGKGAYDGARTAVRDFGGSVARRWRGMFNKRKRE